MDTSKRKDTSEKKDVSEMKDASVKGRNLQWHPPFYAGLQIELAEDAGNLIFENEHQLATKPLEIDILIIKKNADIPVRKNIGRIFRKHNIVEYKSVKDYLGIDDFYQVYAYASLYKAFAGHEDDIKTSEMTITFISSHYPYKLEKYLKKRRKYHFVKSGEGIYHIVGNDFAMQLIVTSRISKEENLWLWSMNNPVNDKKTAEKLIAEYEKNNRNHHYESAMELIVRANEKIFRSEEKNVCEALEEILKDRIEQKAEQRAKQLAEQLAEQKIEERLIENEQETRAKAVLELLEDCGEVSGKLRKRILCERNPALLKDWLRAAARVNSTEEFENVVQ